MKSPLKKKQEKKLSPKEDGENFKENLQEATKSRLDCIISFREINFQYFF